uniref:GAF domain-containing protein n=1 Tax=Panagrellus redivivus TaxID=6233 RepID=A0A7E4VPS1_PANRE
MIDEDAVADVRPIVSGLTSGGQPLISGVVLTPIRNRQPAVAELALPQPLFVVSGVTSDEQPIIQGVLSTTVPPVDTAPIEPKNGSLVSQANLPCRVGNAVLLHGGISHSGYPLIQGVVVDSQVFDPTTKVGGFIVTEALSTTFIAAPVAVNNCNIVNSADPTKLLQKVVNFADADVALVLSSLILKLSQLKMVNQPKYSSIVERLHDLEAELTDHATGLPPDPSLTDLIGKVLAAEYPGHDLQIVVSSSRKTTTTKSFYETETAGMVGLDPAAIQELQKKLMKNISSPEDVTDATSTQVPAGLHVPDVEVHPDAAVQKKEVHEEGFANDDGSEVVAKKMTRVVTTSQSAVSGVTDQPQPDASGE